MQLTKPRENKKWHHQNLRAVSICRGRFDVKHTTAKLKDMSSSPNTLVPIWPLMVNLATIRRIYAARAMVPKMLPRIGVSQILLRTGEPQVSLENFCTTVEINVLIWLLVDILTKLLSYCAILSDAKSYGIDQLHIGAYTSLIRQRACRCFNHLNQAECLRLVSSFGWTRDEVLTPHAGTVDNEGVASALTPAR